MAYNSADWSATAAPLLTTTYTTVLDSIRDRDENAARQFNSDSNGLLGSNHVEGTIKYDGSNKKWQIKEAAGFVDLVGNTTSSYYNIGVQEVRGCHPSNSAGGNNLPRNNNTLQSDLIAEYLGATGQNAAWFRNADNINAGEIDDARLPNSISSDITGDAASASTIAIATSISGETNYNTGHYIPFTDGTNDNKELRVDASFNYNPSSNYLSTVNISNSTNIHNYGSIYIKKSGAGNYIQLYVEEDTTFDGLNFSADTCKSFIKFNDATGSNDPGYIMHETSSSTDPAETNEGILHLVPSDDHTGQDSVWIHSSNQTNYANASGYGIRLFTDGSIVCRSNTVLDASGNLRATNHINIGAHPTAANEGGEITLVGEGATNANVQFDNNSGNARIFFVDGPGAGTSNHESRKLEVFGGIKHHGDMTFTGEALSGTTYESVWAKFKEHQHGALSAFGAGGLTIIGSGESANTFYNVAVDPAQTAFTESWEDLMLTSDGNIRMYTKAQDGYSAAKLSVFITDVKADFNGIINAAGAVNSSSDKRLKKNIKSIPNALEKVAKIKGVTYNRIDLGNEDTLHTGVIAQDVEKVLPEAVYTSPETGMKSVAYGNLVGLLIESIKELKETVEAQGKELQELKG